MKIVFDSNVILSSLITQGLSYRVLDICIDKHEIFISSWIINEVIEKLEIKFQVSKNEIKRIKQFLQNAFHKIDPKGEIPNLCKDSDDNNILFLAQYIKADIIITGDKDLLSLNLFEKCVICNPRSFMEKYYKLK